MVGLASRGSFCDSGAMNDPERMRMASLHIELFSPDLPAPEVSTLLRAAGYEKYKAA